MDVGIFPAMTTTSTNGKRIASNGTGNGKPIGIDTKTARGEIFDYFQRKGLTGATCDEVEYSLSYPHQTASPRVNELERAGVLVPTGDTRMTSNGRKARVLRVSSFVEIKGN